MYNNTVDGQKFAQLDMRESVDFPDFRLLKSDFYILLLKKQISSNTIRNVHNNGIGIYMID